MSRASRPGLGAATFLVLIVLFVGLTVVLSGALRGARLEISPTTGRLVVAS